MTIVMKYKYANRIPTTAVARESPGAAQVVVPKNSVGKILGKAVTPGNVNDTIGGTATTAAYPIYRKISRLH